MAASADLLLARLSKHQYSMGCFAWVCVTGIGACVIALPFLAGALLPLLGFGALGPIAGGIAASAQGFVGSVTAGSIFAILQAMAIKAPESD